MKKQKIQFDKSQERKILLKRLFWEDRDFYKIGILEKIEWFEQFRKKFEKDEYASFDVDEKKEAIDLLTTKIDDKDFLKAINSVYRQKERYSDIKIFIGRFYYFDVDAEVICKDRREKLVEDTKRAVKDTKGRSLNFLRAIIELYKEGRKWDKAYRGVAWEDLLAKIRELGGPYPSPRDVVMLKSFDNIYFKTGSRRYPVHTIPEEMMPTIEEVLDSMNQK